MMRKNMMRTILTIILLLFTLGVQAQKFKYQPIKYSSLYYVVNGRDTNTITCTSGNYGESDFKRYDSTYIFAHIIFPGLPMYFNQDSLSIRTLEVMRIENIQTSYIWRDIKSLWMLPYSYRSEEMTKQEKISSIGWIKLPDTEIRYNPK
jgi:hypothetical protein